MQIMQLIDDDKEWDKCLEECVLLQMPRQIRVTYAVICGNCQPADPKQLWEKYRKSMIEDYARHFSENNAEQKALYDIEHTLQQYNLTCEKIGLPKLTINTMTMADEEFDYIKEAEEADHYVSM